MDQTSAELPVLFFENPPSLEDWFITHHRASQGFWLQIAKKDSGVVSVSYDEALTIALCYGWIDSQKKTYDDKTWIQRFTPRGTRSIWSKVNKDKAVLLIAGGKMTASGLEAIETAKQNGNWDKAYESQSVASLPEDFAAELERSPKAKAFFDTLNGVNKYAIVFRLQNVKKQETRTKRIQQFITMLEKGEKIYP